jgi:LacI family transcriptional regulator
MSSQGPHPGRPARPTMKDVASLAGVALTTVLRVVNDEPTVAPELAARVREAAVKLGYRPNLTASSLRRSQNLVTAGALKAVREAGLQDTVAMVGFDDFQLAELLVPGITVVTQDIAQLGRLAIKLLFDRLDGKDIPLGTDVVATGLTARGSGEIRPTTTAGHE